MFQFPSNGKALSDTGAFEHQHNTGYLTFQFPSNGKALSDIYKKEGRENPMNKKFQFPSNGKALSDKGEERLAYLLFASFNSLQTGKPFRTRDGREARDLRNPVFQFPSNGKALSD